MKLLDRLFRKNENVDDFLEKTVENECDGETEVMVSLYAVHVIVDLIASIVSNIEFKTYGRDEKEVRSRLWIKFNLHPNRNQNSTEFMKELTKKLLLGDVLIVLVDDQFIIADDFDIEERAIKGNKYYNVVKGDYQFRDKFKAEDVIYLKYSNNSVNFILDNILNLYKKLIETAAIKYERSAEEKGILTVNQMERGHPKFKENYEKLINQDFKKFFSRGNRVLPMFEGYKYESLTSEATKKYSNEVSDIKTLFEEALSRTAQAFKVPVGLIRGDVAGIKEAYTMLLTNCIDPIAHMISEELTYKMFSEDQILKGCAIEADTTCIKHVDIFDLAASIDKLIASGFLSIDEVRQKSSLRALNTEWSSGHFMTLNYSSIESVFAGDTVTDKRIATSKEEEGGESNDNV